MEADSLRWWLLIIGSLVIVGLAVHGIWLSRKNSEKTLTANKHKHEQQYQHSAWQADSDDFDEEVYYENDGTDDDLDIKSDVGVDKITSDIAEATSSINEFDELGTRVPIIETRLYLREERTWLVLKRFRKVHVSQSTVDMPIIGMVKEYIGKIR